jgi:hypothetical protein
MSPVRSFEGMYAVDVFIMCEQYLTLTLQQPDRLLKAKNQAGEGVPFTFLSGFES